MQGRCTRRGTAPSASATGAAAAGGAVGSSGGGGGRARVQQAAAARAAAARRERAAARAAEVEDSPRVLRDKCRRLARAIRNAKHLVVYTGAGISTAADIPDYRGPRGVWTRLRRGESVPRVEVSGARPTLTHMALAALWARGRLRFVASQNCDGLHVRAGLPRRALAELHGNMYCERCAACRRVLLRDFDTTERTARHAHATRRLCPACGAPLRDTIVHFGERGRAAWPLNWAGALRHAAAADVILCLGSSLKVLRRYPRLWSMARPPSHRPRLYIVNLQWTPKDSVAALKINARCDDVMAEVCRRLRVRVPRYSARRDPLPPHATPLLPAEAHTARRPPLPAPPPAAPPSPARDPSPPPSPSASDSEEERPLHLVARRALTAFQVSLAGGAATVLLRAEHAPPAPAVAPAPVPAPAPADRKPLSELRKFRKQRRAHPQYPHQQHAADSRHPQGHSNGYGHPPCAALPNGAPLGNGFSDVKYKPHGVLADGFNGVVKDELCSVKNEFHSIKDKFCGVKDEFCGVKGEVCGVKDDFFGIKGEVCGVKDEVCCVKDESVVAFKNKLNGGMKSEPSGVVKERPNGAAAERLPSELRRLLRWEGGGGADSEAEAEACAGAARRIMARAVLLCRAHLYPGLHTILAPDPPPATPAPAPPPPAPAAAQCAWCWARHGARRCLWYPPWTGRARVWRRVHRRRYLCTCCGDGDPAPPPPAPAPAPAPAEAPGWYGKGYRKPRRRR